MTTPTDRLPEIPVQLITPDDVRASIARARRGLERAAEEIVWQIEMEAWRTLGYSSWGAMREAEYGGAAVMLPTGTRPQIAARLKEIQVGTTARGGPKHLTDQEVAATLGVSRRQVQDDLHENNEVRTSAQNVADLEVVDAEIVDDETPTDYFLPGASGEEVTPSSQAHGSGSASTTAAATEEVAPGEEVEPQPPAAPSRPVVGIDGKTYSRPGPRPRDFERENAEQAARMYADSVMRLHFLTVPSAYERFLHDEWPNGYLGASPAVRDRMTPKHFRDIAEALIKLANDWEGQTHA